MTTWTCLRLRNIATTMAILTSVTAGVCQTILFPGISGTELQDALRANYRPSKTLSLDQAKDTVYTIIDNVQDSVEGIYSGYTLYLPDGVDASQWLFMNGTGINLEHVYPQSKGADEGKPGHSDMHHLYPSRVAVNEARASFPFAEIPDNLTAKWFTKDIMLQTIPSSNIDAYSESMNGAFEPRESVKGNIARAVFYFYTMYKADADAADPLFFNGQRETLCAWHLEDPADDAEFLRSTAVAQYQDGKENPFVLDCSAALRAWCPGFEDCMPSSVTDITTAPVLMTAYGTEGQITLRFQSSEHGPVLISVFDMTGRVYLSAKISIIDGVTDYMIGNNMPPGLYTVTGIMLSLKRPLSSARCLVK